MQSIAELKSMTDVPVICATKQGFISYINPSFTEHFAWTESDLIGQPLSSIIPTNLQDAHNLGFSKFLLTENANLLGKPLLLKIITKDGAELNAEHCIIAEKIDGDWEFAASITVV